MDPNAFENSLRNAIYLLQQAYNLAGELKLNEVVDNCKKVMEILDPVVQSIPGILAAVDYEIDARQVIADERGFSLGVDIGNSGNSTSSDPGMSNSGIGLNFSNGLGLPNDCPQCGRKFPDGGLMRDHLRQDHGVQN